MHGGDFQRQKVLFAIVDCAALVTAFVVALLVHDPRKSAEQEIGAVNPLWLALVMIAVGVLWVLVFHASDLYRMRNGGFHEQIAIIKACTIAVLLTLVVLFMMHVQDLPRLTFAFAYILSIMFVMVGRAWTRACLRRWYANPKIAVPLLILGFNPVGQYLVDQVLDGPNYYEPIGFLDLNAEAGCEYRGYPLLGAPDRLAEVSNAWETVEVAIAMPDASREEQERAIRLCEETRIHWWIVPWMVQSLTTGLRVDLFGLVPLIGPRLSNISGLNYVLKRGFDLITASILILLTGPLMAIAALLIRLTDGKPVLFRQTRIGFHGKPFELLKLRTMYHDCSDDLHRDYVRHWIRNGTSASGKDTNGKKGASLFKLTADSRIIPIGRMLRRFSIDELPQLINVWRGEMSLIGPRPALPYEIDHYTELQRRRLDAVPGITGLWQVSGRNRLSFAEMVRLDLQYLEDWSLTGDLKILLRTVPTLLRGSGV